MCIPDATMVNFFNALNVEIVLYFFVISVHKTHSLSGHVTADHLKTPLLNSQFKKTKPVL